MKLSFRKNEFPGKLIVIEGVDGCGKSTIEDEIIKSYKKQDIEIIRTYQPTEWWRKDKNILATLRKESGGEVVVDEAVALFALADRFNHQKNFLEPRLEQGAIILCDRYVYALFAHYMATNSIDLEWLRNTAQFAIEPDLVILLHATPATAVARVIARDGKDRDAYDQNEGFVRKVLESFIELAEKNNIHAVSTDCDIKITLEKCMRLIDTVM